MSAPAARPAVDSSQQMGLVEIGWLVCDDLHEIDRRAIHAARDRVAERLRQAMPEFAWSIAAELREPPGAAPGRAEPVDYLQWAAAQRQLRGWDFVIALAKPDLHVRQRPHAWACISRALESAVISTARIDPRSEDPNCPPEERQLAMSRRVETLALRSIAHLSGLPRAGDVANVMGDFSEVNQLDGAGVLTSEQVEQIAENMRRVADLRLEEESPGRPEAPWRFYLKAAWRNRREIVQGVRQARPWEMPIRLAGLTVAAVTTLVILMMTSEVWDVGLRQSPGDVAALSTAAILVTTGYVLVRQALLVRRRSAVLSEQIVTTNVTTAAVVLAGILVTYGCLFLLAFTTGFALFDRALIASWTSDPDDQVAIDAYAALAGFVSAFGIVIGALGASFEGQQYFRHVTLVDDEV